MWNEQRLASLWRTQRNRVLLCEESRLLQTNYIQLVKTNFTHCVVTGLNRIVAVVSPLELLCSTERLSSTPLAGESLRRPGHSLASPFPVKNHQCDPAGRLTAVWSSTRSHLSSHITNLIIPQESTAALTGKALRIRDRVLLDVRGSDLLWPLGF